MSALALLSYMCYTKYTIYIYKISQLESAINICKSERCDHTCELQHQAFLEYRALSELMDVVDGCDSM